MTTKRRWALRRARARLLLVTALFALVAVTTAILAGSLGTSSLLATATARGALTDPSTGDAGLRVQVRMGKDPAAQASAGSEELRRAFAPVPVSVWASLVSEPRQAEGHDQKIVLWAGDDLGEDAVEVVAGTWPADASQAALQADAAAALGIAAGDTLTLGERSLTVSALWRPRDPGATMWLADPLVTTGQGDDTVGPLIVSRDVFTDGSLGSPFLRWAVAPDAARITPDQLSGIVAAAERAGAAAERVDTEGRGFSVTGDLAATAAAAGSRYAQGNAFSIVPVSVILLVAIVGLVQVGGLLVSEREAETRLLYARGGSLTQVLGTAALEAFVISTAGALLGAGLGWLLVFLLAGDASHQAAVLRGGLLGWAIALACTLGVAVADGIRLARADRPVSGRVRAVAGTAILVVAGTAAAVSAWQLMRAGTFVRRTDDGATADIVSALAPALLIGVTAVVALVVLAPVTRLVDLTTRGTRGIRAWLASAQVARGLVLHAVPVVLTVLATATATFASIVAGTASAAERGLGDLAHGAPIRATLTQLADDQHPAATIPGDHLPSAFPVWTQGSAQLGDRLVPVLAAPVEELDGVALLPEGTQVPVDALVTVPEEGPGPLPVPEGAAELVVDLGATASLDPWQKARLAMFPAQARKMIETEPNQPAPADLEKAVADAVEFNLDVYRAPVTVGVSLLLRNVDTGMVQRVQAGEATVTPQVTGATLAFTATPQTTTTTIALEAGDRYAVDAVQVKFGGETDAASTHTIDVTVRVRAGETDLLGDTSAQWRGSDGIPDPLAGPYDQLLESGPAPAAYLQPISLDLDGQEVTYYEIVDNRPEEAPFTRFDLGGATWSVSSSYSRVDLAFGPTVPFTGADPLGVLPGPPAPETVPVALTPAAAEAAHLAVGDTFDLVAFQQRLPARLAALVPVVPSVTGGEAMLVDSRTLGRVSGTVLKPTMWPSQLWSQAGEARQADLLGLPGVTAVTVVTGPSASSQAAVSSRTLWIAAGCALALAFTGLAAASATQVRTRRPEVAVLRALGMTGAAQAASRALEVAGALALAGLAGIGGGWLVALLAAGPVSRAAAGVDPSAPVRLQMSLWPWAVLLGVGCVGVALICWALAAQMRRQAADSTYREEVR